ncbi:MAG: acylphosphatase [Candidatus Buchananbacteria bacterium]|nr:acylphosphatase [Candidatus Buchananbacteria bacterium]
MISRLVLKIQGQVQGVGFRFASQQEARSRGLRGHVKNRKDGSVEIVAEGPAEDLKKFVDWCYNGVGPAMVQKIEQTWSEPTSEFSDFVIKF